MQIHGGWNFKILDKDVLAVNIFDTWNLEAAIAFANEFKHVVKPLLGREWAILLSLKHSAEVGTLEMLPILQELNQWVIQHGCVLEVHMVKHFLQRDYSDMTRTDKERRSYIHICVNELEEAVELLNKYHFPITTEIKTVSSWFGDIVS